MFIVTGACGHLGKTIIALLKAKNELVRGLILKDIETAPIDGGADYIEGDIRDKISLDALFEGSESYETTVIHTAGIISIAARASKNMIATNVVGTKNIISCCVEHNVQKLVYVSSVHAIPSSKGRNVLCEVSSFSPNSVVGGYAKTKATATQLVLNAAKRGLNTVVVHPSGIIGPSDGGQNHLVQLIADYISGRLPAGVRGGYDFVDVRDVAEGCLNAAEFGRRGECYILSNKYCEIKEVLRLASDFHSGKTLRILPMWIAKIGAPFIQINAKINKARPLYTLYSLYTLKCADKFSHEKATREFAYSPRPLQETIEDTASYLLSLPNAQKTQKEHRRLSKKGNRALSKI